MTQVIDGPANSYGRSAIEGFTGFFVTTEGEVFSTRRGPVNCGGIVIDIPREVPQSFAGRNYRRVSLWQDGKTRTRYVHEIVASAFVTGKATGLQVRHWDGDKEHNHASNLLWGTPAENGQDSVRQGLSTRGERNAQAKLSAVDVIEIRNLIAAGGMSQKQIAARFSVNQSLVSQINTGTIWGHLA